MSSSGFNWVGRGGGTEIPSIVCENYCKDQGVLSVLIQKEEFLKGKDPAPKK